MGFGMGFFVVVYTLLFVVVDFLFVSVFVCLIFNHSVKVRRSSIWIKIAISRPRKSQFRSSLGSINSISRNPDNFGEEDLCTTRQCTCKLFFASSLPISQFIV